MRRLLVRMTWVATISASAFVSSPALAQLCWTRNGGGEANCPFGPDSGNLVANSRIFFSTISGGANNTVQSGAATIGGGFTNFVGESGAGATIAGGTFNFIDSLGAFSFVGGGTGNTIGHQGGQPSSSVIVGGSFNTINGSHTASIGGGNGNVIGLITGVALLAPANFGTLAGGNENLVFERLGTIGGGQLNSAGVASFVGGGVNNHADSFDFLNPPSDGLPQFSAICGGSVNGAFALSFVGGGSHNTASSLSVVGGGEGNLADGSAFVGGGSSNAAEASASVIGGSHNTAIGTGSSVLGGEANQATAQDAIVLGGGQNTASGPFSMAGGELASADQANCFVWTDNSVLLSNAMPGAKQEVATCQSCPLGTPTGTLGCVDATGTDQWRSAPNSFTVLASGGVTFATSWLGSAGPMKQGAPGAGVHLLPGDGMWSSLSDRHAKQAFQELDPRDVLTRVLGLPITTWEYKAGPGVRHMGPMAQDFYAAFALGHDDRHIGELDEPGVALAAIQGLYGEIQQRDETIAAMHTKTEALEKARDQANQKVASLEKRLEAIEAQLGLAKR